MVKLTKKDGSFNVYVMKGNKSKTFYTGAALDVESRKEQHSGVKKGGAKYTKGDTWNEVVHIGNFSSWGTALSFEANLKINKRKSKKGNGYERLANSLMKTLLMSKYEDESLIIWVNEDILQYIDEEQLNNNFILV